jgi:mono/diheme cytochrome c family protein
MKGILRKVLVGVGALLALSTVGAGSYVMLQVRAYEESMAKVYDTPPVAITRSTDPVVIARGKHLVDAVASCSGKDCHGTDLGGGNTLQMGPLGTLTAPNITAGGALAAYSDGEIARVIRYGIKKDGRSAQFMPAEDFRWMPDDELTALVSYLRTVPKSDKPNGPIGIGTLGKVLDRRGEITLDVARKLAASPLELAGAPAPTADYGRFLGKMCSGCHGEKLSGGPIPGAPSSLPVPLNLTPHETGLKGWTYEDFDRLLTKGDRKNGQKLNPFMPIANFGQMNETEKRALFAYLTSVPPRPFGGR